MSEDLQSLLAICPYYKDEDRQKVRCEGLEPATAIHYAFSTPARCREWKDNHCKSWGFEECPIARMLTERYDEDDNA